MAIDDKCSTVEVDEAEAYAVAQHSVIRLDGALEMLEVADEAPAGHPIGGPDRLSGVKHLDREVAGCGTKDLGWRDECGGEEERDGHFVNETVGHRAEGSERVVFGSVASIEPSDQFTYVRFLVVQFEWSDRPHLDTLTLC